jgi:ribosomal protein S18 acetylase RimI-like enzyme
VTLIRPNHVAATPAEQEMSDRAVAQIRIAAPEDAPGLGSMHVASWLETYAGLLPDKMLSSLSIEARTAAWVQIMREPATAGATMIYLAEHEGTIIGFGSCGGQRTESLKDKGYDGEVSAIYVLREFQKRGIGTRLLRAISSHLVRHGFSAAALWVLRDNLRARRFYERLGGKVIAEREDIRGGTVLFELAYGWPDLEVLDRLIASK